MQPADAGAEASLPAGAWLGGLRIERLLARGTSGTLYLAVAAGRAQPLALKVFDAPAGGDADAFAREVQALRRLAHPAIVEVHAAGVERGHAYLATALLPGTDLRRYTRAARLLPEPLVVRIGLQVAQALQHAHEAGVVHRDIKPANLMFDPATRRVWITDFGAARLADAQRTRTGVLIGTPAYMPPEQLAGSAASAAGDIHALGATLFQLLAAELPYAGATMGELLRAIARGERRPLGALRPDLPAALAQLVDEALDPDAARRPDAASFTHRLAAVALA